MSRRTAARTYSDQITDNDTDETSEKGFTLDSTTTTRDDDGDTSFTNSTMRSNATTSPDDYIIQNTLVVNPRIEVYDRSRQQRPTFFRQCIRRVADCCARSFHVVVIHWVWPTHLTRRDCSGMHGGDHFASAKLSLRQLFAHLLYLGCLLALIFDASQSQTWPAYNTFSRILLDVRLSDTNSATFRSITAWNDFYDFLNGPFANGMYKPATPTPAATGEQPFYDLLDYNVPIGPIRLRQLRVLPAQQTAEMCTTYGLLDLTRVGFACYPIYKPHLEDTSDVDLGQFNGVQLTAKFQNVSHQQNDQFNPNNFEDVYSGWVETYSGNGNIFLIPTSHTTREDARALFQYLQSTMFISSATRAVFIDFAFYNSHLNFNIVIRLLLEFLPTGNVVPFDEIHVYELVKPDEGRGGSSLASLASSTNGKILIFFAVFTIYIACEKIVELLRVGVAKFFTEPWTWIEILMLVLATVFVRLRSTAMLTTRSQISNELERQRNSTASDPYYPQFYRVTEFRWLLNIVSAFTLMFFGLRTLKFVALNRRLEQLMQTLSEALQNILSYGIMFLTIIWAFTMTGHLLFGNILFNYSNLGQAFFTCLSFMFGTINYDELSHTNRFLGPTFFASYVIIMYFIMLNMFMTILNFAFSNVKQKDDDEIQAHDRASDFVLHVLRDGLAKMRRLYGKVGRSDNNSEEEFRNAVESWKKTMLNRGYSKRELASVFSYNSGGFGSSVDLPTMDASVWQAYVSERYDLALAEEMLVLEKKDQNLRTRLNAVVNVMQQAVDMIDLIQKDVGKKFQLLDEMIVNELPKAVSDQEGE